MRPHIGVVGNRLEAVLVYFGACQTGWPVRRYQHGNSFRGENGLLTRLVIERSLGKVAGNGEEIRDGILRRCSRRDPYGVPLLFVAIFKNPLLRRLSTCSFFKV
jgi:hypothetical protein